MGYFYPTGTCNGMNCGSRFSCLSCLERESKGWWVVTTWEQDLVQQVQEGIPGAFAKLVRRYEPSLKNSVYQILGDADATADVIQDAFISTYEKIHLYNPNYRYFSWVYRIAINGALNKVQRRKFSQAFVEKEFPCPGPAPDTRMETREREAFVKRALAALEFKYRVLLVLRHYLDLSYSEIAMFTGLPVSTVRSRLHTARVLLKEELHPKIMDDPIVDPLCPDVTNGKQIATSNPNPTC
jgi:RNA polymerase sigma-70 factor, ECF subfamily